MVSFDTNLIEQDANTPDDAETSRSKKRRRDGKSKDVKDKGNAKADAKSEDTAKTGQRKQIVRIRAKVHCTAAGQPGLDAPAKAEEEEEKEAQATEGEGGTSLPKWHPLEKVYCV